MRECGTRKTRERQITYSRDILGLRNRKGTIGLQRVFCRERAKSRGNIKDI